jgi:hypothetical protein
MLDMLRRGVVAGRPAAQITAAVHSSAMATKGKAVSIGTHNGTFHCDEAFGCWMLRQTERFQGDAQQLAQALTPACVPLFYTTCPSNTMLAVSL